MGATSNETPLSRPSDGTGSDRYEIVGHLIPEGGKQRQQLGIRKPDIEDCRHSRRHRASGGGREGRTDANVAGSDNPRGIGHDRIADETCRQVIDDGGRCIDPQGIQMRDRRIDYILRGDVVGVVMGLPWDTVRMRIDENVWKANVDNWDVEAAAGKIVFRDALGSIRISVSNRNGELNFERLNIGSSGHHLRFGKKSGFIMSTRWGEELTLGQATFEKFKTGILLEGPILAVGADAQPAAGAETSSASVNSNVRTQEKMREIFQAKLNHYGMAYMTAPDFGGREPSTFTNAVLVIR